MLQNMAKGHKSISVIASEVIGSLLRALLPERDGSSDILYGIVSLRLHLPTLVT